MQDIIPGEQLQSAPVAAADGGPDVSFADLGVRDDLLRAIGEMGFASPMPIQRMVIPHLLSSEGDVVGLAQTAPGTSHCPHKRVVPADSRRYGRLFPLP